MWETPEDRKNQAVLDRIFNTLTYPLLGHPDYFATRGPVQSSAPNPSLAHLFVLCAILAGCSYVYSAVSSAVYRTVLSFVSNRITELRPQAIDYTDADLDRIFVLHPVSTYAAYAPDYGNYEAILQGPVWDGNGVRPWKAKKVKIWIPSDPHYDQQVAVIDQALKHGENSPEYLALAAEAWKLCHEGHPSGARCSLGRNVPEAQFDDLVELTHVHYWNNGVTSLSNENILALSDYWRRMAQLMPNNPEVVTAARHLDPLQHGWKGKLYMKLLSFQYKYANTYDVTPVTRH